MIPGRRTLCFFPGSLGSLCVPQPPRAPRCSQVGLCRPGMEEGVSAAPWDTNGEAESGEEEEAAQPGSSFGSFPFLSVS